MEAAAEEEEQDVEVEEYSSPLTLSLAPGPRLAMVSFPASRLVNLRHTTLFICSAYVQNSCLIMICVSLVIYAEFQVIVDFFIKT